MKKLILRCIALLISLCTLLPLAVSCARKDDGDDVGTETVATEKGDDRYKFPEGVDFQGREYNILNCYKDQWAQLCLVTSHEMDGTAVNDAVFKRTAWLEESLNCTLTETNIDIYEIKKTLDTAIDSGDIVYGAAYMQVGDIASEILANRLTQLDYVENMNLEEDYWSQELMKAITINNRHYSAVSDAHLMHFDGSWCVFFNKKMLDENKMDLPYDLVRSGDWTLEKMVTMSRQLANLNGDETWDLDTEGNARYGFTTHIGGIGMLLYGVNAQFGQKDVYDIPYLTASTNEFTDRAEAIGDFCVEPGTFLSATANNNEPGKKPENLFINGRVAFAGLQIFAMNMIMKSGGEFGIVPFPKYDENQEEYNVSSSLSATFLTIPYGYAYTEDMGLIMDAMSHEADRTLEQVYYIDHLELKSNTGEVMDNIEMLNLIRERRSCDIMVASGIDMNLYDQICRAVRSGGGTSSTYASYAPSTEVQLKKIRMFFGIN